MNHTSSSSNHYDVRHSQNNCEREAIVDKLHGALAVLRRERDELHRAKEMSVERLRLAREERYNAEKHLSLLQDRYNEIASADVQGMRKADIEKLQEQVQRLGSEVKFHHAELIGKREKMDKFKTEMLRDESIRGVHHRAAKEAVCLRRQKVTQSQAQQVSMLLSSNTSAMEQLNQILKEHGSHADFFIKIQRLMKKKCSELDQEHVALEYNSHTLRKRIAGYKSYLGTIMTEDRQAMMSINSNSM